MLTLNATLRRRPGSALEAADLTKAETVDLECYVLDVRPAV